MNKKAKLARLSSAFRLRFRFRSYIVFRFVGTLKPAAGNDGVDEADGLDSCEYVGLVYIVDITDGGIAMVGKIVDYSKSIAVTLPSFSSYHDLCCLHIAQWHGIHG